MKLGVLDYGAGNLRSVLNAFAAIGAQVMENALFRLLVDAPQNDFALPALFELGKLGPIALLEPGHGVVVAQHLDLRETLLG